MKLCIRANHCEKQFCFTVQPKHSCLFALGRSEVVVYLLGGELLQEGAREPVTCVAM
jgi:hypothetical protein